MNAKTFLFLFLVVFCKFTKAGSIITNITSLPSFGNVYPFNSSSSLNYTVSGTSLTAPIVIAASTAFEVSLNYNYGYGNKIILAPLSGAVANTKIFVRFSPSLVASYPSTSNAILNSSIGSVSVSVSVSGTCIATTVPSGVNTYFNSIGNVRGAALKTALYNKISVGTTSVSYTPGVWNAYATTDVQPNGKVWDIYSTRLDQASPYEYTMSTNQCGTYSTEGNCYNREHSFPQSWFNSASPMVTELNHVFASDGKVNGMRNNYPYGYVTNATYTSLYGGKLGTSANNFGYTGVVFEPIDEYKGDLARGYFFMATRYENLIASWISNAGATDILAGNNYPVFLPWQLSVLLSWHNLDPVSDKEIKRNNAIAAIQGNRNPFIDSPQYAQRIWGGAIHNEPTIASTDFSYTNNGTNTVNLNWKTGNGVRRLVICKAGSAVNSLPIDTVAYTANSVFGNGSNIGNNCFVVYNGTGSSCDVTGLNNTTNYYFAIVEYNGVSNISNYNTTTYFNSGIVSLPVNWLSLNASAGSNGSISPLGIITVNSGAAQRFTFTPNSGYKVDSVIVDGIKVDSIVGYTFSNVTSNRSIRVTFTPITYTISTQTNSYGTVSPSGNINIAYGGSQRILFTPNSGFKIDSVIVDGIKVDSILGYTFNNVTSNVNIRVTFIAIPIIPYITISSIHPTSNYINTNTLNNIVAGYQVTDSLSNALLSSLSFTTQGTYTIADIQSMGFKCWLNSSNDLTDATQIGTSQAFVASGGVITFTGLSQNIPIGTSYILVTCNISNTAENGNTIGLAGMPIGNFTFSGNNTIIGNSTLAASNLFTINETGPVKMQYRTSNSYRENFSDIANWTNGFASGIGAGRWAGVTISTGTIPNAKAITISTANFQTSSSGAGIQRGSLTGNVAGTINFLSLGNTDNTSACAVDFFMDFTRRNADSLVFDAATVFNATGNRNSTLRVFWSIDGTNFTELTGNNLPYIATNNIANSATIRVKLPSAFNNASTCRLRFYYHNGTGGTTALRPKISIDNLQVTAICPIGTSTTNINSCTPYTWNGETYSTSGVYNKTFFGASAWGCDSVASLNLNINPIASFNPFQDTLKICGATYSLNSGSGFTSYLWNTGATTANISPTRAGWYKVTVSNGTCSASDSVYLSLNNAKINKNDTTVCPNVVISLIATDSAAILPLSYLWSNGAITSQTQLISNTPSTYYCTISNGINSCTDSSRVKINSISTYNPFQDTLKACGTSYTLNAGNGYVSYLWNTGTTSSTISTSNAGWYKVTVSNGACSASDSVLLSIINANIINNDSTIVAGTTFTLRATGTGIISNPLSYMWSNGVNTQNITVNPIQNTNYYCTVSNSVSSCTDTVKIGVNVNINLKMYFEAFYDNGSLKSSLNNADGMSDISLFDTIQIMLYDSISNSVVYSIKSVADTGGNCQILVPSAYANNRYYIGIKHRGSIETWSSSSVLLNNGIFYNFTNSASKAYGANLKDNGNGIYLIYNGDVNQDGAVDFADYPDLDIGSSNGDLGYLPTDLNGDGSVDFGDYPILDINSNDGIIAYTPIIYNAFRSKKSIKKSVLIK